MQSIPEEPQPPNVGTDSHVATAGAINKKMITTLIIRNVPYRVGKQGLIEAIHSVGFAGRYQSITLPVHKQGRGTKAFKSNAPYAFVTFQTPDLAERFVVAFDGFVFPDCNSSKRVFVESER